MHHLRIRAFSGLSLLPATCLWAQAPSPPAPATASAAPTNPFLLSPEERARLDQLSREDHADMLRQLGITKLRPGANGRAAAGEPGAANYDPAKANPYPDWPDALTLKDGRKVTTAEMWWQKRRPEIAEDFEREVYGRVPKGRAEGHVDGHRDRGDDGRRSAGRGPSGDRARRQLRASRDHGGHQDGGGRARQRQGAGACADDVRLGQHARRARVPVPGRAGSRRAALDRAAHRRRLGLRVAQHRQHPGGQRRRPHRGHHRAHQQGHGAGRRSSGDRCARGPGARPARSTTSRRCRRSTPSAWASRGSRATARPRSSPWPSSRVSRWCWSGHPAKAAPSRTAATSAKRWRTSPAPGEYHWMAGNFLKYGAAEASFGSKNANDIPVDAHELIALCAPRPTFISYGIPEKGDANWLDQQGSYMATVAAGPVFRLLGARDIGVTEDYRVAKMPPDNTGLLDGELAWRQHDGGHEDRSNMSFFIAWANRLLHHTPPTGSRGPAQDACRPQLSPRPPAAPGQGEERGHRRLFPGRLHHAPLGRSRLPGLPGPLERELPRLERRQLRLGRRPDGEHPVAARRTASSTASTRRSSCCSPAPTTSGRSPATSQVADVTRGL